MENIKKKVFLRAISGFSQGVCLGYMLTIIISLAHADGYYYPCAPTLYGFDSEITAVVFQVMLCGVLGSTLAAASVIWQMSHWRLAKQTGICFLLVSTVILPFAFLAQWMTHSLIGFLQYFIVFFIVFAIVGGIRYAFRKYRMRRADKENT